MVRHHSFPLFVLLVWLCVASTARRQLAADEWAELKVQILYDADRPPPRKLVDLPSDPSCMPENLRPFSEALVVDPRSMGIKNFVIWLETDDSQLLLEEVHPSLRTPPSEPATLAVENCVFSPHVQWLRTSQPLILTNRDAYGHSPHFIFLRNPPESRLQPPQTQLELVPALAEKVPTPIRCQIHPWMSAFVLVLEHPYAAVSDEHGFISISKLPANRPLTFRLWHENAARGLQVVRLGGIETPSPRGRLRLSLSPGVNDLGGLRLLPGDFLK